MPHTGGPSSGEGPQPQPQPNATAEGAQIAPGATGAPPAADHDQQEAMLHPISTTLSPFRRLVGDLMSLDGQQEPELIDELRILGDNDKAIGLAKAETMTFAEIKPILDRARSYRRDRLARMLANRELTALPEAARFQREANALLNSYDEARRAVSPIAKEVRGKGKKTKKGKAEQLDKFEALTKANTLMMKRINACKNRTARVQEITEEMASDPKALAPTLQQMAGSVEQNGKALTTIGLTLNKLITAMTPCLFHVNGLRGVTQELMTDTEQFRAAWRENVLSQAAPAATAMEIDSSGGVPARSVPAPTGPDPLAPLSLTDRSCKPSASLLRHGHGWEWQDGKWQVIKFETQWAPANVKTLEARREEWAENDRRASIRPAETTTAIEGGITKVRLPPPQPFTGQDSEVDPEVVLMGMETYFTSIGLDKNQWGQQVQTLLRGKAHAAYGTIAMPLYTTSKQFPTWDQVRSLILSFRKEDRPAVARAQLNTITQTGTVSEYNHAFRDLITQLRADPPAITDQINAYLRGLKDPQVIHPMGHVWPSLESVQEWHLTREHSNMRSIVPARPAATSFRLPPRAHTFKRPVNPRVNALSMQKRKGDSKGKAPGSIRSDPGAKEGNNAARNRDKGRADKPRFPDEKYGKTLEELFRDAAGPCPNPEHDHPKYDCNAFKRIVREMQEGKHKRA